MSDLQNANEIIISRPGATKSASMVSRRLGTNRLTNLRYKITDLSQHPQSQPIFIKVFFSDFIL